MEETKIIYHIDDEDTPYLVKVPVPPERVTLADFKNVLNRPNYKFFFKSMDDDFGVVKEEIVEDDCRLPCFNGRVVSWLVAADGSSVVSEGTETHRPRPFPDVAETSFTESESAISTHKEHHHHHRGPGRHRDKGGRSNGHAAAKQGNASVLTASDIETTSFLDSEDETTSRISTTTEESSVSRIYARHRRRRRKKMPPMSRVRTLQHAVQGSR